jgi:hypothetical protein
MSSQQASTSAKILYRPVGLISSVVAGLIAGSLFRAAWHQVTADGAGDPPKPLESEYTLREILVASVFQGAVFAVVKALTQRGGAKAFERLTGEWPGS